MFGFLGRGVHLIGIIITIRELVFQRYRTGEAVGAACVLPLVDGKRGHIVVGIGSIRILRWFNHVRIAIERQLPIAGNTTG